MTHAIPRGTEQVFVNVPKEMRARLETLRALILETAAENSSIGPLEETLKWNEPAFLTSATKSGTTIRINAHKKSETEYAMYVHCQTDLVERYKQLYSDVLKFEGTRAVIFNVRKKLPVGAVKHCIEMTLTYHLK
ncbi:DUF1801 domain-containing protein [Parasphingorhabdus halotolerans]|uniref:DUF1801 domain-containing protein n=1 Tax=Parasphingorhabdus halotolerans TaxID=2725558 RepID=A0A6H2DNC5_9SPHN|nr:DUF1801 domain-containing protein [Parasphingorhabdus halotolerans]QJB69637.1 DUF1801 domain-containing protein [Parasphingorhabdus halotolerans]